MWTPPYAAAETAAHQAEADGRPKAAQRLRRVAAQPRAVWFTDALMDPAELTARVTHTVRSAASAGQVPILVTYAIPLRDCGGASHGGAVSSEQYLGWIQAFAAGLSSGGQTGPGAVVIVEPDALALLEALPAERRAERLDLLRATVSSLAKIPRVSAYLDAGNGGWLPTEEMARLLSDAGVAMARGFSLNVSNFRPTAGELRYGEQLARRVGWKPFVVDTGRNGRGPGPSAGWCNPPGRALGYTPRTTPAPLVDAYLWVKPPGESDGSCRAGQPPAGVFWPAYADELARASGW